MYVGWRRVSSWYCSACGECCYKYKVKLTFYEYLKLKNTGFVEEKANRYYIKKIGGKCPFQIGRLCSLQGKLKPIACKLYPFFIRKKGGDDAFYEFDGEEYYVYVNLDCPNVVLGKPKPLMEKLVREALMVYRGEKRSVELITARVARDVF